MADFALLLKRSTRYEAALKEAGFTVACAAVLEFAAINASVLAEHASRPRSFRGVVLTSARAVEAIAAAIDAIDDGDTAAQWHAAPCYIVGARTAECAQRAGFADCRGAECGSAYALGQHIIEEEEGAAAAALLPLLFPCAEKRRDELPSLLRASAVQFIEVAVYRTAAVSSVLAPPALLEWLAAPTVATAAAARTLWVIVFSPSGVAAAQHSCAAWLDCSSHDGVTLRFAAIGPTTGGALAAVEGGGWAPCAVAETPSPGGLVAAIARAAA